MNKLVIEDDVILGGKLTVETKFHDSFGQWVDLSFGYEGQDGAEEFRITPSIKDLINIRDILNNVINESNFPPKGTVSLLKDPITGTRYLHKNGKYLTYYNDNCISHAWLHPLVQASLVVIEKNCTLPPAVEFDQYFNPTFNDI